MVKSFLLEVIANVCFQSDSDEEVVSFLNTSKSRSPSNRSRSPPKLGQAGEDSAQHNSEFVVRHKDDKMLENRDFSTFINPKPRRSRSPTRRSRSLSPSKRSQGNVTSESIPGLYLCSIIFCHIPKCPTCSYLSHIKMIYILSLCSMEILS